MTPRVKIVSTASLFIACMGLFPWSAPVEAQSARPGSGGGARMMIVQRNDDGTDAAPQVMHFSMPDLFALRQPDFLKRDLPIFTEKLGLSEAQQSALERQIDAYIERFNALKKEKLAHEGEGPMFFAFGGGEDGEGGPMGLMLAHPPQDMDELDPEALEALEGLEGDLPAGMAMDVGVRVAAGMPGEEGAAGAWVGGAPAAGEGPEVSIEFSAPNGEELPEDVRQQLEKRAAEMAEKIREEVARRQAENPNGLPPGEDEVAAALPGMMPNIEELQQRQADLAKRAEEFGKAKEQLRQDFITEAQSPLAQPQLERWPALERALLREKTMPKGRIPGERTDLFKVIKSLNFDESTRGSIATQLDQYELALDSALRQRNDFVIDATQKIDKAMQEQNFDRALSLVDRATALRTAVRSVNEQFAGAIAVLLPAEQAETFRAAVLKTSYPMVYRKTFGSRTFEAASKIEGLDEATRSSIASLEKGYAAELAGVNEQIRRAIDVNDPKEPRRPIEHMKQIAAGTPPEEAFGVLDDPQAVRKAFNRRADLDKRYAKSVADLLTPEQAAQLPQPPKARAGEPIIIRRAVGDTAN